METPCLVCEENCPVTPKAIHVHEFMNTIRHGRRKVLSASAEGIKLDGPSLTPSGLATGDYYLRVEGTSTPPLRITANSAETVSVAEATILDPGINVSIQVQLGGPVVDPDLCIGCGVCEHECPVSGLRAIRVSSENESRNKRSKMKIRRVDA
jgi:formate hydrogenlyase subunit 6/NADH:ubiquinone oxidoreductase subunit I